jgi:hypothetical protein
MTVIAVVGSAPCALNDLAELREMCADSPLVCVLNRSILLSIDFDYFLTGHQGIFAHDVATCRDTGKSFFAIGAEKSTGYDDHFRPHSKQAWGGSAANAICYFVPRGHRVVLCGCPFDTSGHFNDESANYHAGELWDWFLRGHPHREGFNVNVRSMSGQTRELFGYPEKEWLNEPR